MNNIVKLVSRVLNDGNSNTTSIVINIENIIKHSGYDQVSFFKEFIGYISSPSSADGNTNISILLNYKKSIQLNILCWFNARVYDGSGIDGQQDKDTGGNGVIINMIKDLVTIQYTQTKYGIDIIDSDIYMQILVDRIVDPSFTFKSTNMLRSILHKDPQYSHLLIRINNSKLTSPSAATSLTSIQSNIGTRSSSSLNNQVLNLVDNIEYQIESPKRVHANNNNSISSSEENSDSDESPMNVEYMNRNQQDDSIFEGGNILSKLSFDDEELKYQQWDDLYRNTIPTIDNSDGMLKKEQDLYSMIDFNDNSEYLSSTPLSSQSEEQQHHQPKQKNQQSEPIQSQQSINSQDGNIIDSIMKVNRKQALSGEEIQSIIQVRKSMLEDVIQMNEINAHFPVVANVSDVESAIKLLEIESFDDARFNLFIEILIQQDISYMNLCLFFQILLLTKMKNTDCFAIQNSLRQCLEKRHTSFIHSVLLPLIRDSTHFNSPQCNMLLKLLREKISNDIKLSFIKLLFENISVLTLNEQLLIVIQNIINLKLNLDESTCQQMINLINNQIQINPKTNSKYINIFNTLLNSYPNQILTHLNIIEKLLGPDLLNAKQQTFNLLEKVRSANKQ